MIDLSLLLLAALRIGMFVAVVTFILLSIGAPIAVCYFLWKILGVMRYMEFSESMRLRQGFSQQDPNTPRTINPMDIIRRPVTRAEADGDFVPVTELDSYMREEAQKLAIGASISDSDAMEIIKQKIKEQNEKRANGADV